MKFKLSVLLIAQVAISSIIYAQNTKKIKKGDIVPGELALGKMVNYESDVAKFFDFRGKLIILDFWASYCSPCIDALPRMDSLQKEFGDKLVIISITSDSKNIAKNIFKKKNINLISVVEDSVLQEIFPHKAIPYEVWIDENGRVLLNTLNNEVNSKSLAEYFLSSKLPQKEVLQWDPNVPLIEQGDTVMRNMSYYSLLKKSNSDGAFFYPKLYENESKTPLYKSTMMRGMSITHLYVCAFYLYNSYKNRSPGQYPGQPVVHPAWIIIEAINKQFNPWTYFFDYNTDHGSSLMWIGANRGYDYDLKLPSPGASQDSFSKYILEDFNRVFGLNVRFEKRKVTSWIIVKKDNSTSFLNRRKDDEPPKFVTDEEYEDNYLEGMKNYSFNSLINQINNSWLCSPPIFNETGYINEKISLNNLHIKYKKDKATSKKLDLEEWRAAFQRNGLDIKVEDREVEVMVFKKKETPSK